MNIQLTETDLTIFSYLLKKGTVAVMQNNNDEIITLMHQHLKMGSLAFTYVCISPKNVGKTAIEFMDEIKTQNEAYLNSLN